MARRHVKNRDREYVYAVRDRRKPKMTYLSILEYVSIDGARAKSLSHNIIVCVL